MTPTASSRSVELPALTVGLADVDAARRRRLAEILGGGGLEVVVERHEAAALVAPDAEPFQAAVLAWDALGPEEFATVALVRDARPTASVIAVAATLANPSTREAFGVGVDGVVLGERAHESLALAVRAAHAGQLCLPNDWKTQFGKPALSPRQKQILAMVVMGFTNSRIARALGVAESTVKSHLFAAFRKLGVRSRGEATALILDPKNGLGTGILAISGGEEDVG